MEQMRCGPETAQRVDPHWQATKVIWMWAPSATRTQPADTLSASVYGRVIVPLGRKPPRINCRSLYALELQRLRHELEMAKMGANTPVHSASGTSEQQNWATERLVGPPGCRTGLEKGHVGEAAIGALCPTGGPCIVLDLALVNTYSVASR